MKRMDRRALALAIAAMLVLGTSGSASAFTISGVRSSSFSSYLQYGGDWNHVTVWNYDGGDSDWDDHERSYDRYGDYQWSYFHWSKDREDCFERPIPEPSAAVVFGLGLLVASGRFSRRMG